MWQSISQWIQTNKLFEGAAVGLFAVIGIIIKRFSKAADRPSAHSNSSVTVPIQITNFPINPPPIGLPNQQQLASSESTLSTEKPSIISLRPRTCCVEEREQGQRAFVECNESRIRVAVATYRRVQDSSRRSLYLTAWLQYFNIPQDGTEPREVLRVKNGTWLEEDFNSAAMSTTDTKEVVVAVQMNSEFGVVQDNRFSLSNNRGFLVHYFPDHCHQIYASVHVVDEKYGTLSHDLFRIWRSPFRIERDLSEGLPVWRD